jgi:hypothetical protein
MFRLGHRPPEFRDYTTVNEKGNPLICLSNQQLTFLFPTVVRSATAFCTKLMFSVSQMEAGASNLMKPNSTTQVIKYGLNPLVLTRDLFLLVHY